MAGRRFDGSVTLAAATPAKLLDLVFAKGYDQSPLAGELTIRPDGDIRIGNDATLNNTNGYLLTTGTPKTERGRIDLNKIWLYSVGGTTVNISCEIQ